MIKAIIFDVGGVFDKVRFFDFYEQYLGVTQDELLSTRNFEGKELRRELDVSKISLDHYFSRIKKRYSLTYDVDTYIKNLRTCIDWNEELFSFLTLYLNKKYELFIFSNNSELFIDEEKKEFFSQVFKKQFYSFEIKKRKPDLDSYKYVLEDVGLEPQDCLFVDDKERNLLPARELGMKVILYESVPQLKKSLTEKGIDF